MKKWKEILQNCPYLAALLISWVFMTAGSIGLMIYRNYDGPEKAAILSSPLFAIIMNEEIHGGLYDAPSSEQNADLGEQNDDKISHVTPSVSGNSNDADAADSQVLTANQPDDANEEVNNAEGINSGEINIEGNSESNNIDGSETEINHPEEEEIENAGRTIFEIYTPVETNSIYYSDSGKIALTTEYAYTKVEEDYFTDAAFIGDSRTLGISDYAKLDADFYCESGMTIYKLLGEKGIKNPRTGEKVNLNDVLQQKEYGKIYIMLGMNELGYRNTEYFYEKYKEVVEQIREWQPQAVIFIMANLHVSREKNNPDTEFNNININAKNSAIANLADGINVFYIDSNPLFVDEGGFLKAELTFDGVHLYANSYSVWRDFLMEHGVIKDEN